MTMLNPPQQAAGPAPSVTVAGVTENDGASATTSTLATTTTQPENRPYRRAQSQPSSTRLRANLLQKLGIDGGAQVDALPLNINPSRGTLLGPVKVTKIPLRDHSAENALRKQKAAVSNGSNADLLFRSVAAIFSVGSKPSLRDEPEENRDDVPSIAAFSSNNSLSTTDSSNTSTSRGVRFEDEVTVIPIPTRAEYSDRIRSHLWDSAAIINANAQRNSLEFCADGWDWRSVLEEDAHYINPETGELIHPVHVEMAAAEHGEADR